MRVGINRYYNYIGAHYGYLFPIYFAHHSKTKKNYESTEFETFRNFIIQPFSHLFPSRTELNTGPIFGYFKSAVRPITKGYKLNNLMYMAVNAKLRLTFQIWRINLGGIVGASYIPSKNLFMVSPNPMLNGNRTNWSLEAGALLSFSFD